MGPDWRARDILPSEQNSERNIIKKEKIRPADFFLNFAAGKISLASANITSPKAKYHSRVARIKLRPTGSPPLTRADLSVFQRKTAVFSRRDRSGFCRRQICSRRGGARGWVPICRCKIIGYRRTLCPKTKLEQKRGIPLPCGSVGFPKENGGVQPPRQIRLLP